MGLFRRESLHERLAREGGLTEATARASQWDDRLVGIHGLARQRHWDTVVTADAPELEGDRAAFVALARRVAAG